MISRILAVALLFVTTPALAGVVGGPFKTTGRLKSMDVDYHPLQFQRGKVAILAAESAHGEDIDCYVYDLDNNVLAVDTTPAPSCDLHWKVKGSGKVRVAIWNMDRTTVEYTLTTN